MLRPCKPSREGALLLLVLAVAAFLRFMGISFQSYWNDELFSASVSDPSNTLKAVYLVTVQDVHPPGYQVLLWAVYKVFGYTELAGRALSAVAGVVGVAGVYLLGREAIGRRAGLYAALIAALNAFLIYYSQEARSYSCLFALSAFSTWFFVRTVYAPKAWNVVGYAAVTILATYTHYFGFALVAGHAIYLLGRWIVVATDRRRLIVAALLAGAAIALAHLPQLSYMEEDLQGSGNWIPEPPPWFLRQYVYYYVRSMALLVLFGLVLILTVRRMVVTGDQKVRSRLVLLATCVGASYLFAYVVSVSVVPVLSWKNTIIVTPALIVLIAAGIDSLKVDLARRGLVTLIVLLSFSQLFFESEYYTTERKQNWRWVAREVATMTPDAPAFGVRKATPKFNTYFRWLESPKRCAGHKSLIRELEQGAGPDVFWLLGLQIEKDRQNMMKRFDLVELERLERGAMSASLFRRPE